MSRPISARRRLSEKDLAVLAMLQSGYNDLQLIAHVLGMPLTEVEEIESADDMKVRRVLREGMPEKFIYRTRRAVKCRLCGSKINLIPCVLCNRQEKTSEPQ